MPENAKKSPRSSSRRSGEGRFPIDNLTYDLISTQFSQHQRELGTRLLGITGKSPGAGTERLEGLLLPASAQSLVELDQREHLIELSLHQAEFGREVIGVVGEHLEIAGGAA